MFLEKVLNAKKIALPLGLMGSIFLVGCGNSSTQQASENAKDSVASSAELPKEVRLAWGGGPRIWVMGKEDGDFEKALGTKVKWVEFGGYATFLPIKSFKL